MYKCKKCSAEYKTKVGLIKHKNKHHSEEKKNYLCSYCEQEFSHYQNRWKHEQTCKEKDKLFINVKTVEKMKKMENKIAELSSELYKIKNKPASKTINKTVNNNFICVFPLGSEPNNVISQENLKQIIVKNGLNSILEIVKRKHFNPALPQCQNFCVTGKNDAYANVIDPETKRIKVVNKKDVFDKVYFGVVTNVNSIKTEEPHIIETIEKIKQVPMSKKMCKKLHIGLNEEAYHNKEMVQNTWTNAKFEQDINNKYICDLNNCSVDSDDSLSDSESDNEKQLVKTKIISEIQKLLADIDSKSHLFI